MVISENKLVKLAIKLPAMSSMKGSHSNALHTTCDDGDLLNIEHLECKAKA